ncbi:MAG: hypothetical protein NC187_09590 [Candidatus Amulumruptor caecigallinarius]|nr:hypothetical protein [Candidatus Amulumruptor caecigallinarius]MCM1397722.1 hypothetical protein [Candidatus Amulumruptor caecigallinarius]MCM1454628.1 hypothetical protein [bacterium]
MKKTPLMIAGIAVGVLLIAAVVIAVIKVSSLREELNDSKAATEQLQLANEQLQLDNEYAAINAEFQQYENQAIKLANDSILAKYTAAKSKVEELRRQLKQEKNLSAEKIKKLQDEIGTLKGLLRHYIAQIDSLNRENAGLKQENAEIKTQNQELTARVNTESQRAEKLSERMTLAEKLNVTGVSLTALKKNGKTEKNITKARQLMVTFTIPQNNSTPVGAKTIYLRLTGPEGSLLGNAGSFAFEGGSVACTAKKTVEYAGEELAGIKIYWDVNTALNPGDYTVELFTDGYRLCSRHFTMQK